MAGASISPPPLALPFPAIDERAFWQWQGRVNNFPEGFWLNPQIPAPGELNMRPIVRLLDRLRIQCSLAVVYWGEQSCGDTWRALEREVWQVEERLLRAPTGAVQGMKYLEEVLEWGWKGLLDNVAMWQTSEYVRRDPEGRMLSHCRLMFFAACNLRCITDMARRHVAARTATLFFVDLPRLLDAALAAMSACADGQQHWQRHGAIRDILDIITVRIDNMTDVLHVVLDFWYRFILDFQAFFNCLPPTRLI